MPFKKGESGNLKGKPKGARARRVLLSEALAEHGLDAGQVIVESWRLAMEERNANAAVALAAKVLEYTYAKPNETTATGEGNAATVRVVFDKPGNAAD